MGAAAVAAVAAAVAVAAAAAVAAAVFVVVVAVAVAADGVAVAVDCRRGPVVHPNRLVSSRRWLLPVEEPDPLDQCRSPMNHGLARRWSLHLQMKAFSWARPRTMG